MNSPSNLPLSNTYQGATQVLQVGLLITQAKLAMTTNQKKKDSEMMKPHHYSRNLSSPCSFLGKTFLVGLPQQPTVLRCLVSCAWDQSFKDSVKFAYKAQHKKGTTAGINCLAKAVLRAVAATHGTLWPLNSTA